MGVYSCICGHILDSSMLLMANLPPNMHTPLCSEINPRVLLLSMPFLLFFLCQEFFVIGFISSYRKTLLKCLHQEARLWRPSFLCVNSLLTAYRLPSLESSPWENRLHLRGRQREEQSLWVAQISNISCLLHVDPQIPWHCLILYLTKFILLKSKQMIIII
jgi:hypothetical protein